MRDLESTLHYSFRQEIALHRTIDGEKLSALRQFVNILAKVFYFHLFPYVLQQNFIQIVDRVEDVILNFDLVEDFILNVDHVENCILNFDLMEDFILNFDLVYLVTLLVLAC